MYEFDSRQEHLKKLSDKQIRQTKKLAKEMMRRNKND